MRQLLIFKSLYNRVEEGQLQIECTNEEARTGEIIKQEDKREVITIGRTRIVGWIDTQVVIYTITINGFQSKKA